MEQESVTTKLSRTGSVTESVNESCNEINIAIASNLAEIPHIDVDVVRRNRLTILKAHNISSTQKR